MGGGKGSQSERHEPLQSPPSGRNDAGSGSSRQDQFKDPGQSPAAVSVGFHSGGQQLIKDNQPSTWGMLLRFPPTSQSHVRVTRNIMTAFSWLPGAETEVVCVSLVLLLHRRRCFCALCILLSGSFVTLLSRNQDRQPHSEMCTWRAPQGPCWRLMLIPFGK